MSSMSKYKIWKERVSNYHSSHLKAQDWCTQNNVTVRALRYWVNKFNKEVTDSPGIVNEFVHIATPSIMINPISPIVIRFGKISMDVSDNCHIDTLRNVLEVLGAYD